MREPLTTERLWLRDVTEADAELLFDLDVDPEVMRYIGFRPSTDIEWYRDRIRRVYMAKQAHPWQGIWLVFDQSRTFLGWVFVRSAIESLQASAMGWTDPNAHEVGFRFHRVAWGQGIATEAAAKLVAIARADPTTTAIVACADVENRASRRVLEKLGLQRYAEVLIPGDTTPTVLLRHPNR